MLKALQHRVFEYMRARNFLATTFDFSFSFRVLCYPKEGIRTMIQPFYK